MMALVVAPRGQQGTSLLSAHPQIHPAKGLVHGGARNHHRSFYPRLDVPNMQDMQYVVTDGVTFVDLERDATKHAISMPDEKALEFTVTNTDARAHPSIGSPIPTSPTRVRIHC